LERLLLLWDELDELVGYGRHLGADLSASLVRQGQALRRRLSGFERTAVEAVNPLN
jgi:hypothetical protein